MPKVIPLKNMDIIDKADAEILATQVHFRVRECYKPSDPVVTFRVLTPPPNHDVLVMLRDILVEEFECEDVEWHFDDFMWDIIVYRQNIPLL